MCAKRVNKVAKVSFVTRVSHVFTYRINSQLTEVMELSSRGHKVQAAAMQLGREI
jgi:hypothetical protein